MSEFEDLLVSIARTIKDYRAGEIAEPTPEHVEEWSVQFRHGVQVPLLREIDHVLKKTYLSRAFVRDFFTHRIKDVKLAGGAPCDFWRAAHVLDIQQQGHSQVEIRALFAEALNEECGLQLGACGSPRGAFIYLDDVLFSGRRITRDLEGWILEEAPAEATVHIVVIASHRLGEWQTLESLKKAAAEAKKKVTFRCWAATRVENRKSYRSTSEVLWPTAVSDDDEVQEYIAGEARFPFEPRTPGGKLEQAIFSCEEGRQLLEREMLLAGVRIRSFSESPSRMMRPLGYSAFGLGFGSMIVTYRNCPNNTPLALWWGDPDADPEHPFSNWYPLLPRKTYTYA